MTRVFYKSMDGCNFQDYENLKPAHACPEKNVCRSDAGPLAYIRSSRSRQNHCDHRRVAVATELLWREDVHAAARVAGNARRFATKGGHERARCEASAYPFEIQLYSVGGGALPERTERAFCVRTRPSPSWYDKPLIGEREKP
jgi:hypothetical protein